MPYVSSLMSGTGWAIVVSIALFCGPANAEPDVMQPGATLEIALILLVQEGRIAPDEPAVEQVVDYIELLRAGVLPAAAAIEADVDIHFIERLLARYHRHRLGEGGGADYSGDFLDHLESIAPVPEG
ncbi:MAG: hypothetical protein F6K00_33610 [Leptolyngbya sp. SIOISBB]|nr:hypothetical protein [Leptolyngbya sp. SIOISBB]